MDLKKQLRKTPVQLAILFVTLFLYLISLKIFPGKDEVIPSVLGILVFVEMIGFVFWEVKEGVHKHGWKHEIVDTVLALAVALIVWFAAGFILNTNTPVSGVVSCSMKPNLHRGDFVIIQGAAPVGYKISITQNELQQLQSDKSIAYFNNATTPIDGSLYSYCASQRTQSLCKQFLTNPKLFKEQKGPFTFNYDMCTLTYDNTGAMAAGPCVHSVDFKGKKYIANFSHDTIVYQSGTDQLFAMFGDIVHRVLFVVDVNGKTYYITRGDNNPVLDIQMYSHSNMLGNDPVPQENFKGKVIGRIPILGYFKLLLHWYVVEDQQCKWQLQFPHV